LTVYRILQLDNEPNISQLFAAARHKVREQQTSEVLSRD
jgi:hypothetical protein